MPFLDLLLPELDHELATTRTLLARLPEARLDWAPHPKAWTLGQLAQHLVTILHWGHVTLTQPGFDTAGARPSDGVQTREALLGAFDTSARMVRASLVGVPDEDLLQPWALTRGTATIFTMPRVMVWRSFVMNHLVHHRGQLALYLRMTDVPVPSIYGPSADESTF